MTLNECIDLHNVQEHFFKKYRNILMNNEKLSLESILDEVAHYYENIIECMPGNVYWLDKNGTTMGCNHNVLKMFGFESLDQFKGLTFEEMGHIGRWTKEATESFKNDTLEVIETGIPVLNREEPPIPNVNGKTLYFLTSRVPLRDKEGHVVGVVGISIDISERKEMEQALKIAKRQAEIASQSKTDFLENMRHDIRTPLSGIIGLSEILIHETDPRKTRQYTQALIESSHELLRFLNEILEAINIVSGQTPVLMKKFNLKDTLDNLIKLHQPKALEKNLKLSLRIDNDVPEYVLGDPIRIYRILLELLVNALKFTDAGEVSILIKLAKKQEQKLILQFFVKDTGIGIPAERQSDLFLLFKKLTPSYQDKHHGAGLGLSIVKQFLEDLEGEIYVKSEPNVGTEFVCVIPVTTPLLEHPFEKNNHLSTEFHHTLKTEIMPQKTAIVKHGLVVEDHPIPALVAKELFQKQGCIMEVATTGQEALLLVEKNLYDFILMDIGLPDLNGYEVTKRIRHNPDIQQPLIIGLTGHTEKANNYAQLGINLFLHKPLTNEIVTHVLNVIPSLSTSKELLAT